MADSLIDAALRDAHPQGPARKKHHKSATSADG
jgi:hypothetical protein